MTAQVQSRSGLMNFYIFCTDYGQKEGHEDEKIMVYVPQDDNIDTKIRNIGLSEAMIRFTETFKPNVPCEVVHTLKTRQVFYNPEGNFWMVLIIRIPITERVAKDGKKTYEYHEEDVLNSVAQSILRQAYLMFRLFNGSFKFILDKHNLDALKERLAYFFTRYLQTINFSQIDILDVYQGIAFLTLDKGTFLKVQSLNNLVQSVFKPISHFCFLYHEQLIWTTLEQDDMRILFKYLSGSLFPSTMDNSMSDKDLFSTNDCPQASSGSGGVNAGRFLTLPSDVTSSSETTIKRAPRIFIGNGDKFKEFHFIVYRAIGAVLCLLVDAHNPTTSTFDFYQKLHGLLGPQLGNLSGLIADQSFRKQTFISEQQYRFLYFNEMNLAIKSSIHSKKSSQLISIPPELMKLIVDIHSDFQASLQDGEITCRTYSDCWVVGRHSYRREFFVILNQKNANLVEIDDEIKRLASSSFNNIFFLEH